MLRAVGAGLSDVGRQREHNEDRFILLPEYDLYIVADGMGGHRAGDVASRLATEVVADFFRTSAKEDITWPFPFDAAKSDEENRLICGVKLANRGIFDKALASREMHGMGTTLVALLFGPATGKMVIAHVGDSRCYRVRHGRIELLTRDHSLINEYLLAMPELPAEQRDNLPKNVITRALGMHDHVQVDTKVDAAEIGDIYILCSDGLSGMMSDEEIGRVTSAGFDLETISRRLIELANENGGEDNVTAVVVRIEDASVVVNTDRDDPESLSDQYGSENTLPG